MQDTFLRVFAVAVGLLMSPKFDPGVEEWDDTTAKGMHEHEEILLREGEKLDLIMEPRNQRKAHTDDNGTENSARKASEEQREPQIKEPDSKDVAEKQDVPLLKDSVLADHKFPADDHFIGDVDLSLLPKSKTDTEANSKAEQVKHDGQMEVNRNLELDKHNNQGENTPRLLSSSQWQQKRPEANKVPRHHTETSERHILEETVIEEEEPEYLLFIWNTLSIVSLIRFFWKYSGRNSLSMSSTADDVLLPDSNTLQHFHSKCIQAASNSKQREEEFLDGFVSDLVDAMRTVCEKNGGMMIDNVQTADVCNITVPLRPPELYSFKCLPWKSQASDILLDMQICSQIKLVEHQKIQNGCPCQASDTEDMVCLLHSDTDKTETKETDAFDGPLCQKNSPFLSKLQVAKWFQSTVTQGWSLISHKYEFELNIRDVDAAGALVVQFRSGMKIRFRLNPVVKFHTDHCFFITPCSPHKLDTFWTLSLISYEDRFLQCISERLPNNSCHIQTLEIAHFLHKKQTALSGSSALKHYHFKMALLQLLLIKHPAEWEPDSLTNRLQDLLTFIGHSLETKQLHHVLIGNPLTPDVIQLPAEFVQAEPVNLFHPLVVHKCIYRNASMHFQEMLKNAQMLIQDYVK